MKDNRNMLKFIDLFAGIGGIRLGFDNYKRDKNTKCVFASEIDKFAKKTYETNFNTKLFGDITKANPNKIPKFDVLLGGFPCQPFSMIGQRKGFHDKTRGTLFFNICDILKHCQPKAFLLENVQGLLTSQNGYTFKVIKRCLKELHYHIFYKLLNAKNFGVPQNRVRLIIVGFRDDIDCSKFIMPTSNSAQTVYITNALQQNPKGYQISKYFQKSYLFKKNDGHPFIVNPYHPQKCFAKTLNASYYKIQRLTGTFVKDGKTSLRLLSKIECERLQGFAHTKGSNSVPKDFKFTFPVSRTQMYKQLGNAVAIPMIKAVSDNLKAVLRNQ